jgi:hypothetical protein
MESVISNKAFSVTFHGSLLWLFLLTNNTPPCDGGKWSGKDFTICWKLSFCAQEGINMTPKRSFSLPLYFSILFCLFFPRHNFSFRLLLLWLTVLFSLRLVPPPPFAWILAHHVGRYVSVPAILFLPHCGARSSAVPDNLIRVMETCDRL